MGAGDLQGDIKAKAQTLLIGPHRGAAEGLEQPVHGLGRNGFAPIGDGKFEVALMVARDKPDGLARGAVGERVGQQVRGQLGHPAAVAFL